MSFVSHLLPRERMARVAFFCWGKSTPQAVRAGLQPGWTWANSGKKPSLEGRTAEMYGQGGSLANVRLFSKCSEVCQISAIFIELSANSVAQMLMALRRS